MKKKISGFKADRLLLSLLLFSVLLRLFYISAPFSGHHFDKEVVIASAARYMMGERTPIVVMYYQGLITQYGEFVMYVTTLMFSMFGVHEWAGRLPMLVFAVSSVYLTYLIGLELFDRRTALFASFMMAISPLHTYFGRVMIQEGPIVFFMLFSVLCFVRWTKTGKLKELGISALFLSLAIHQKFTLVYLAGVYASFLLFYKPQRKKGVVFLVLISAALGAPLLWKYLLYSFEVAPVPLATFGAANYPILLTLAYYQNLAIFFIWSLSPIVLLAAVWGFFLTSKTTLNKWLKGRGSFIKEKPVQSQFFILIWFSITLISILGTGQWGFLHDYYLLIVVPPSAFLAANALSRLPPKRDKIMVLLLFFTALPIIYYINSIEYPDAKAGMYLNGKIQGNESLVGSPTVAYYSDANIAPFWSQENPLNSFKENEKKLSVRYIAYPDYLPSLHSIELDEYLDAHYRMIKVICSDRPSFGYTLNLKGNARYDIDLKPNAKCIRILERK